MAIDLELRVSNDERVIPVVRSFVFSAFAQSSLEKNLHERLAKLVVLSVGDAVMHAYQPDEEGAINIRIKEIHGKLEITVRDFGMPQDIMTMESVLHAGNGKNMRLFGISCKEIADEVHWTGYGREGKALCIGKWLHNTDITKTASEGALKGFGSDIPAAPAQEYTIRRMVTGDGLQVSQLIYKAYGGTYFNADVYYPERIEALNAKGTNLSFLAIAENGKVVGHYALERNVDGPVAEGGEAVVDPSHRGRKLLERMKETALKEARRIGLVGVYADTVTVHPYTQKSNVHFGAKLACANLGIAPRNEHFFGLAEDQPQRISCLLYYLHLGKAGHKKVHVPQRHKQIAGEIYANLGFPVEFRQEQAPKGKGGCSVSIDSGTAKATIRVEHVGMDTAHAIRHARRGLTEHSHAEVVFADLPLADPATPFAVEALEEYGFSFAGIAPHFSTAGDVLRMLYLTEPLKREHIVTYEEFAGKLVEYVLSEQERVRRKI
ncbi:MAG: GNAT family N-acetyltransferase [Chlorobiales bacterium]|nr:GNAT family N-acetyltransferase [Chlorobiales bacterium]